MTTGQRGRVCMSQMYVLAALYTCVDGSSYAMAAAVVAEGLQILALALIQTDTETETAKTYCKA